MHGCIGLVIQPRWPSYARSVQTRIANLLPPANARREHQHVQPAQRSDQRTDLARTDAAYKEVQRRAPVTVSPES